MSYVGTNYGETQNNIDHQTGIHYGVITQNELPGHVLGEADEIYEQHCPKCGAALKPNKEYRRCPSCYFTSDDPALFVDEEPSEIDLKLPGYQVAVLGEGDVYVTESPFYTLTRFCSPCAPNAGDLTSPTPDGIKTYCLGEDVFDTDTPCPYPVYSVATGELVAGVWGPAEDYDDADIRHVYRPGYCGACLGACQFDEQGQPRHAA